MNSQRLWVLGIVVLVLAAIVNVGALNVAEQGFIDLRETAGWVRHTQRAQNLIEHILRLAVDAETAQRGYLMTGRDTQLERYNKSRDEIPGRAEGAARAHAGQPGAGRAARHGRHRARRPHGHPAGGHRH